MKPLWFVLIAVAAVLSGALIADAAVAVTAGAVVLAAFLARIPVSRFAAGAAAVVLAGAGVATLFEADLDADAVTSAFADLRPVASQLGALGAVLVLVAAGSAFIERRGQADRARAPDHPPVAHAVGTQVPAGLAPIVGAAALIRVIGSPATLSPVQQALADNVDAGLGFLLGPPGQAEPTTYLMPLPALVEAFSPLPATLTLTLVSTATVAALFVLSDRLAGRRVALAAGWIAAVTPALWGQQLPEAVAALAVVSALLVALPGSLTRGRAIGSGALVAVAGFARPECLLLVAVLAAWWSVHDAATRRRTVAMVLVVVVLVLPWSVWVHGRSGSWMPTTSLGPTVAAGSGAGVTGDVAGAADPALRPRPEADEPGVDRDARRAVRSRLGEHLAPELVVRRVLRGWDLWSPSSAADVRASRGLPLPGGPVGGAVEIIVVGLAAVGAWVRRRRWRDLLPLLLLPAIFTVETALTFGDRGLRGWVAPTVVILAGLGAASLLDRRRDLEDQPVSNAS